MCSSSGILSFARHERGWIGRVRALNYVYVRPPHGTHITLGPDDPELGVSNLPSWKEGRLPLGPFKGVEDPHSRGVCQILCVRFLPSAGLHSFSLVQVAAFGRTHILLCYSSSWGGCCLA